MRSRIIIIVVALILGGAAAVAAATYLNSAKVRLDAQSKPVEVLVATQDIDKGTSADELFEKKLVEVQEVPAQFVAADAISSQRAIEGQVLSVDLSSGEQLTAGRFQYPSKAGLAYNVPETYVAVSVPVDKVSGVAGLVKPGDQVVVLSTIDEVTNPGTDQEFTTTVTKIIIAKARVLAVASDSGAGTTSTQGTGGALSGSSAAEDKSAGTVTLALSPADAEKVVYSVNAGAGGTDRSIWLALLPTTFTSDVPATSGQTAATVLR
jgi:pilus assembly protein CpaB